MLIWRSAKSEVEEVVATKSVFLRWVDGEGFGEGRPRPALGPDFGGKGGGGHNVNSKRVIRTQ